MRVSSILSLAAIVLAFTFPVDAGYVFMKNGYIIQGRIVEEDDEKIILRWASGEMTIYNRFVSELVLDASEEQDLREAREIEDSADEEGFEDIGDEFDDPDLELPADLTAIVALHEGSLMQDYGPAVVAVENQPFTADDTGSNGSMTDDTTGSIPSVESTSKLEEKVFGWGEFALTVPQNWEVAERTDEMARVGSRDAGVVLTVHVKEKLELTSGNVQTQLREILASEYPGAVVLGGHEVFVGTATGYAVEGKFPDTGVEFTLTFVTRDDRAYLIATVQASGVRATKSSQLASVARSLRFIE